MVRKYWVRESRVSRNGIKEWRGLMWSCKRLSAWTMENVRACSEVGKRMRRESKDQRVER